MNDSEKDKLISMVLASYLQKATTLIGVPRKVGGNQFRHGWATTGVLIDHKFIEPIKLKAALLHDIYEDWPEFDKNEIIYLDSDGFAVHHLIWELTRKPEETKEEYLDRLTKHGSKNARMLKVADRITNLLELNPIVFPLEKIRQKIAETRKWVLPMAKEVSPSMTREMEDIIERIENYLNNKKS